MAVVRTDVKKWAGFAKFGRAVTVELMSLIE